MVNDIGQQEIHRLTTEIWSSMLGIELQPTEGAASMSAKVSSCVQILGEWEGAVRLDISLDLASAAAAAFLGVEAGDISSDQIRDAAGELANMTAGSLKTLLPKPCKLSLPSVATGSDFELTIQHGRLALSSSFEAQRSSERLIVSVFERIQ